MHSFYVTLKITLFLCYNRGDFYSVLPIDIYNVILNIF